MSFVRIIHFLNSVLLLAALGYTQESKPQIKHVPAPATPAFSGKEMFKSYCASCHGETGKGDGPAASALKTMPSNLTVLARNNSGQFPSPRVVAILRGNATVTAHGNHDMPVWGPVFWHMGQGHEADVHQRIVNLTQYLESLQQK